jgi:hypothetical protein
MRYAAQFRSMGPSLPSNVCGIASFQPDVGPASRPLETTPYTCTLSATRTMKRFWIWGAVQEDWTGTLATSLQLLHQGGFFDVAVEKARSRAVEACRAIRNQCFHSDILTFCPTQKYDVIFFGDSIYYIPSRSILPMLRRYSGYLTAKGVFIARMFDVTGRHSYILETIERDFDVIGEWRNANYACIFAFRPQGDE